MPRDIQQQIVQLNQQVVQLYQQGRYEQAIDVANQACDLARQHLGEGHPSYAASLHNLADLYEEGGDVETAESLYWQALEIMRVTLGEDHPDFATGLNNLASLYQEKGDFEMAESLYLQSLEIVRGAMGEAHPYYAASLHNLAALYYRMGDFAAAEPLYRQAIEIRRRALGENHPDFALSLSNLAVLYRTMGDFEAALPRCQQALEIWRRALGEDHPRVATSLNNLAVLYRTMGNFEAAEPLYRQALEIRRKALGEGHPDVAGSLDNLAALVEFVRFDVFDFKAVPARGESQWKPARYLAFVLPAGEPDNVQMIDLGEAEPLDQMVATYRSWITGEAESRGERDLGALPVERLRVPGTEDGSALRAALFDSLLAALGGRKRLLLAPDGDLTRLPFEVLPAGDGRRLIDDYQISYLSAGQDVLRFGAPSPGQPADPLVVADPDFDLAGETDGDRQQPGRASRVATSPPSRAGFWSRWLGRRGAASPPPSAGQGSKRPPQPADAAAGAPSGRRSRELDRNSFHFPRLPGTRREGERIAQMLGVRPWLEGAALEANLKARRSPRVLHLATHGFFLEDQKRDPNRGLRDLGAIGGPAGGGLGRLSGPGLENPLLRSGLSLAGANTWFNQGHLPAEAEDGLLTAEDVSGLDLLYTDLVVLSACETGLGKVHIGEGVFGLRRAFVLAGARTLVMSLWKVPDQQTQELMEDFYRSGGESVLSVFRIPGVVSFVGHMVDRPGRPTPRFLPQLEEDVRAALIERLEKLEAGFGYASAACGSDILFLEAMLARKGEINIILPYKPEEFVEDSVDIIPQARWPERFQQVRTRATQVFPASEHRTLGEPITYEYSNRVLQGLATIRAQQLDTGLTLLAVWDGNPGDGPGGTATTVHSWRDLGYPVEVVELAKILDTWQQRDPGLATTSGAAAAHSLARAPDPAFPKQIVGLLFADVVGFGKLSEEQFPRFITHFLDQITRLVDEWTGSHPTPLMKDTWGDGLYFVFSEAEEVARFALMLRDRVHETDWSRYGLPADLSLRIAIHAGPVYVGTDPVAKKRNYLGSHTTLAARIEPVTPPGQVYASQHLAALVTASGLGTSRSTTPARSPFPSGRISCPCTMCAGARAYPCRPSRR